MFSMSKRECAGKPVDWMVREGRAAQVGKHGYGRAQNWFGRTRQDARDFGVRSFVLVHGCGRTLFDQVVEVAAFVAEWTVEHVPHPTRGDYYNIFAEQVHVRREGRRQRASWGCKFESSPHRVPVGDFVTRRDKVVTAIDWILNRFILQYRGEIHEDELRWTVDFIQRNRGPPGMERLSSSRLCASRLLKSTGLRFAISPWRLPMVCVCTRRL